MSIMKGKILEALDNEIQVASIENYNSIPQHFGSMTWSGADFAWANLDGWTFDSCTFHTASFLHARLKDVSFVHCSFNNTDFTRAQMDTVQFRKANFRKCMFTSMTGSNVHFDLTQMWKSKMKDTRFISPSFIDANLSNSEFLECSLLKANFSDAMMAGVRFDRCNIAGSWFYRSFLKDIEFVHTNLSQVEGLPDPSTWIAENFELDPKLQGYIVYKGFDVHYDAPSDWKIEPGATITEVVNRNPAEPCGCGVNFASLAWCQRFLTYRTPIWRCLLPWDALPNTVVPYDTDGKARTSKLILLDKVPHTN